MDAVEALGEVFARWATSERTPALAWGLIRDGDLAETGSLGTLRVGEGAPPDADSVFRIASMTKSFTGAALMSLVAKGRIHLDEPAATYVSELASWRGPTTDGPPLTVRHLVSMESGLPSDDPWADRHVDLPTGGMDALIAAGASFTWTPGTHFEYSNLGWGLVGRIIERVAGPTPQELVSRRLLDPLGMTRTTWTRPADPNVAEPYRWQDDGWVHAGEPLGDGTIAPMGGLWSTVSDLARWVAFFCDADPPRDDPDDGPLPRWARREMQQPRRMDSVDEVRPRPDGLARTIAFGYGIGLSMRLDPRLGTVVAHSGGLPGYGSHMRWLPDRNIGVVALSNVTYGNMTAACAEALDVLADLDALPAPRPLQAAPRLLEVADRAVELVNRWDDAAARALFSDNVEMDDTLERRAKEAADVIVRHGPLTEHTLEVDAPQRGDVVAAGGQVRVEIELNHGGDVQWWYVRDRAKPSDAPITTDPATLAALPRSAYVLLRPVADLVDAFERWQGEVLDRLGGARCMLPAPHATFKSWGSSGEPIAVADEDTIAALVAAWADATDPVELTAAGLDLFEGEGTDEAIPVMLLAMSQQLRAAMSDLWARSATVALPVGYSDHIGVERWLAHLSLCYPRERPAANLWEPLRMWLQHQDIGGVSSVAYEAELVTFGDGTERRLGRFPFRR
jgi:CubicO group peptidase (beta-lactamase class C family)